MAEEFTKSQLAQNRQIVSDKERLDALELEVAQLRDDRDRATRQLSNHSAKLRELDPLRGLIEFVETIKSHFANFRLR